MQRDPRANHWPCAFATNGIPIFKNAVVIPADTVLPA